MNLGQASADILFSGNDYLKIKKGIEWMHDLYASITDIRAGDLINEHNIKTQNGHIVTPAVAAHCLIDLMRSTRFIRGAYKAIKSFKETHPNRPLRILYAGCGPYATILTPLTTQFDTSQIQCTMLEYNPISMKAMETLYRELKIEDFIEEKIIGDATLEDIPLNGTYDIIISETMQVVLQRECQVPLTRNLVRFLNPEGTFIPQNVYVNVHLVGKRKSELENPENLFLENIYDLDYNNVPAPNKKQKISIPEHPFQYLYYFTRIRVFEEEVIEPYESGLTIPLIIDSFQDKPKAITFQYVENEEPHFEKIYHME